MRTILIDYNRIGHAKTIRTALLSDERGGMSIGMHVLIVGDDVPEREAVITDLTDGARQATFSFGA